MKRWLVYATTFLVLTFLIPSVFVGEALDSGIDASTSQMNVAATAQLTTSNTTALDVLVIVSSAIYEGVRASLEQYRADLEKFGFENVFIITWSDANPLHIRETLQQFYANSSLAGVLLVGDLPAAEYEMFTNWDYERFPMDLYYMDLDGNWTDSDSDGVFDMHVGKGKLGPEIWVGRIQASNLGQDEVYLINKYFEKNHQYRTDALLAPRRALLYIDDDWADFTSMDSYSLGLLYDNIAAVTGKNETTADDFTNRLTEGYEWVHVRSHGSWDRHSFVTPAGATSVIQSTDYAQIDPNVLFYQLFVCSAARFTEPNYLAGEAVFKTGKGLLAVGSTKLGGMLMFWTFYEALARGRTIGDAFREWFVKWGEGRVTLSSDYVGRKWFYGLTIIGDPTLRLRWLGEKEIADLQRREEEVVDDLPLVQDLLRQINSTQTDYSALSAEFNSLQDSSSSLQGALRGVSGQLADIRNLLYFFLLVTLVLLVWNVYLVKSKPKSKTLGYG